MRVRPAVLKTSCALSAITLVLFSSCSVSSKKTPSLSSSGELVCPPTDPKKFDKTKNVDGDKDGHETTDWLMARSDDGHGHDVEVWCLDKTPRNPTPEQINDRNNYYFATRLSHPDGSFKWFALCIFDRGNNELRISKADSPPWQGIRWNGFDNKPKPDYQSFNDIHYRYAWLDGNLVITLTQNGDQVGGSIVIDPPSDERSFDEIVREKIRDQTDETIPEGGGRGCSVDPR